VISLYTPTDGGEYSLGWIDANTVLVYGWNVVCGSFGLRAVSIQPLKITTLLPGCFSSAAYDPASQTIGVAISQITSEGPGQNPAGLYLLKLDGTLQKMASGDIGEVALPANTGTVWGYNANQSALAFRITTGAAIALPAGAPQQIPLPAPGGKTWAISNGNFDKTPGLWIGTVGGVNTEVFDKALTAAAWALSGKALAFISDKQLYFAITPDYQPVLYGDTFPVTELMWVKP
jgi:hypothetical protein